MAALASLTPDEKEAIQAERDQAVMERARIRGYIAKLQAQEEAQSRAIRRFDVELSKP